MRKIIFSFLLIIMTYNCAKGGEDSAANSGNSTSSSTSASQVCRKYPTSLTDTTNSFNYTCTFNGTTTVSCTNGGTATVTYTWPSLGEFIEETPTGATYFNRNRFSSFVLDDAASNGKHNFSHTYNSFGQLTGVTDSGPGFAITYTYTAWDAYNRPTAGTFSFTSGPVCTGRNIAITYVDGTTRTKTFAFSGGVGANCGSLSTGGTDQQDSDGNPLASVLGRNYTINTTGTACYSRPTDSTAPTIGTAISFSSVLETSLTVNWGMANDAVTVPANLQYRLVRATSAAAIDTVAEVDAISGADLLQDYTANDVTQSVTGLTGGTTYFFAVVVRDAAGNKAIYAPVSQKTQTCRRYATNITDTTNSFTYTCSFNGSTTVSCTNGGTATITFTYANLQTFVDAAASPVTIFNRPRGSTLVVNDAASNGQHNYNYTYNGSGQLTTVTDSGPGFATTYTYTAWDAHNRPITGTSSFTSGPVCTGRSISIAYVDGTTRTATYTLSGGTGANCALLSSGGVDQQDADGNPIQSVLGRNYTVNSTSAQCY